MRKRLPNLIIAGVNKGGTTSLFSYLVTHPEVCGSSIKETCFFLPTRYGEEQPPITEYHKFFSHCGKQKYVMESTPGYFYGGRPVAETIQRYLGPVRIVVVFRDPVDRLFSFYRFMKSMLQIDPGTDIEEYLHRCDALSPSERRKRSNNPFWGLEGGFYADYLPAWQEVFGDDLMIVFFDDLKEDPAGTVRELCRWLKIDPVPLAKARFRVENRTLPYRLAPLHKAAHLLNRAGERFFRAHPELKSRLRRLYTTLNEDKERETLSPELRIHLNRLYADANSRLAAQLRERGHARLPGWLVAGADLSGEGL